MNEIALLVFLAVVGIAAVIYWISPGEHKMPSQHLLNQAAQASQAPPPPPRRAETDSQRFGHAHSSPGVIEALDRGNVVEAIRRFREIEGVGLAEAKAIVDELRKRRASHGFGSAAAGDAAAHVPQPVLEAIDRGETILAIRRYREATGVGLAEAKAIVDAVRRRRNP